MLISNFITHKTYHTWKKYIKIAAKRYILDHDKHVCDGEPFQDCVYWCFAHILSSQHNDVQDVGYCSKYTNLYSRNTNNKSLFKPAKLKIVLNLIQHNFNEHQLNLCLPEVSKHAVRRDHILFML